MVLAEPSLPTLPPAAFWSLIGLVVLMWVFARVQLVRRQRARGAEPTTRLLWIQRLAAWRGTYPVLALLAAGLVVLLASSV